MPVKNCQQQKHTLSAVESSRCHEQLASGSESYIEQRSARVCLPIHSDPRYFITPHGPPPTSTPPYQASPAYLLLSSLLTSVHACAVQFTLVTARKQRHARRRPLVSRFEGCVPDPGAAISYRGGTSLHASSTAPVSCVEPHSFARAVLHHLIVATHSPFGLLICALFTAIPSWPFLPLHLDITRTRRAFRDTLPVRSSCTCCSRRNTRTTDYPEASLGLVSRNGIDCAQRRRWPPLSQPHVRRRAPTHARNACSSSLLCPSVSSDKREPVVAHGASSGRSDGRLGYPTLEFLRPAIT
jgi:hypothetical protein